MVFHILSINLCSSAAVIEKFLWQNSEKSSYDLFFQIPVQSYFELSGKKKKGVLIGKMNKLENISEKPEIITIFFHHINFQPFSILGICWPHCTSKDICSVHADTTEFVEVERKSHPYTYFSENLRIYQTNQQHSPAFLRGEYEVFPW